MSTKGKGSNVKNCQTGVHYHERFYKRGVFSSESEVFLWEGRVETFSRRRVKGKRLRRQKRGYRLTDDRKDPVLSEACVYVNKLWERSWRSKAVPSGGMI